MNVMRSSLIENLIARVGGHKNFGFFFQSFDYTSAYLALHNNRLYIRSAKYPNFHSFI